MQLRKPNLNAYKHGLTSQTLILQPEDKPAYDQHCQSYADLYRPVGRPEQILVQMIADDYWRALRGRALETAHLSRIFERPAGLRLDPQEEKTLNNLALYLQRIERSIRNNTKALQEMQSERKKSQPEAQQSQQPKPAAKGAAASTDSVFSPPPSAPPAISNTPPPRPESQPEPAMKAA